MKSIFLILAILALVSSSPADNCWKDAIGRGVGEPLNSCGEEQKDGALCYPYCHEDFKGVGPVCWQNCPSGFKDTGVDCLKPEAYGRGAGYVSNSDCHAHNSQGCEKNGLLWYPKCKEGFYAFGCCICSPKCVNGMTDVGISCQKQSYGRGAGTILKCGSGLEQSGGLCYPPCYKGYYGDGPVCWANCPTNKFDCGWLCTGSQTECTQTVKEIVKNSFEIAAAIAAASVTGDFDMAVIIAKMGQLATDLANGICQKPTAVQFLQQLY